MEQRRRGRPSRSALFDVVDQGIEDLHRIGGLPVLTLRRAAESGRLIAELRNGRWYSTKAAVDRYVDRRDNSASPHTKTD